MVHFVHSRSHDQRSKEFLEITYHSHDEQNTMNKWMFYRLVEKEKKIQLYVFMSMIIIPNFILIIMQIREIQSRDMI